MGDQSLAHRRKVENVQGQESIQEPWYSVASIFRSIGPSQEDLTDAAKDGRREMVFNELAIQ